MRLLTSYRQRAVKWYNDLVSTEIGRKSWRWLIFGTVAIPVTLSSCERLPSGHVAVVQNIFGNCRASLFDEDHVFWIIPFYEKSYALRTWPVRKRLVQELVTKDNKVVEIVIHLRLRVKVCWAQDIVTRMGTDFSRTFLEQEVSLDAETVVSEHTYDELLAEDDNTANIVDDLIGRTRESACFCRLELLDMVQMPTETPSPETASSDSTKGAGEYIYGQPLTSPFYYHVISPFCNKIVENEILPRWITPNQISFCGLLCAVLSVICARLGFYILAAPFWMLYGLLDNLDGKQARATKTSSRGGDFVDHAIDSIVASLSALINLILLVPTGMASWVAVWFTLSGELPFYFGAWAHHVLGRVILGTQIHGTDLFTVDELNFIWVPSVCLLRRYVPSLFDFVIFKHPLIHDWVGSVDGLLTFGMVTVFTIIIFAIISSIYVVRTVYRSRVRNLLLPGLGFGFVSILLRPPLLVMIPCFSLIAFELLGNRLNLPHSNIKRIWIPIGPFIIIGAACRIFAVEVTWGLSNPCTATVALVLSCLTLALLIRYKDALNQSALLAKTTH